MDEDVQDLGMPGVLKNAGRPVWSVEAFQKRCKHGIGTDRHKKLLNLGDRDMYRACSISSYGRQARERGCYESSPTGH